MHKHAYAKHTEINWICSKLTVNKHKTERKGKGKCVLPAQNNAGEWI